MSPALTERSEEGAEDRQIQTVSVPSRPKPNLALDVDGTLAKSKPRVFELMGEDVSRDEMVSWDWPIEQFGADRFLGAFADVWSLYWAEVEPCEKDLKTTVRVLKEFFNVHIVTAQPDDRNIVKGKHCWLEEQGIAWDDFVTISRDRSKGDLYYDVYIDDKPSLPQNCSDDAHVYLIDQPYNQDAPGEYTRVDSVKEAAQNLIWEAQITEPVVEITHE